MVATDVLPIETYRDYLLPGPDPLTIDEQGNETNFVSLFSLCIPHHHLLPPKECHRSLFGSISCWVLSYYIQSYINVLLVLARTRRRTTKNRKTGLESSIPSSSGLLPRHNFMRFVSWLCGHWTAGDKAKLPWNNIIPSPLHCITKAKGCHYLSFPHPVRRKMV
jgi:hypothetical protein